MKKSYEQYWCSFCGKLPKNVERMIAGPGTNICNECIGICSEILKEKTMEEGQKVLDKPVSDEQFNAIRAANDTEGKNAYIRDMEKKTNFYMKEREASTADWHVHSARVEKCNYIQTIAFLVILMLFAIKVL